MKQVTKKHLVRTALFVAVIIDTLAVFADEPLDGFVSTAQAVVFFAVKVLALAGVFGLIWAGHKAYCKGYLDFDPLDDHEHDSEPKKGVKNEKKND